MKKIFISSLLLSIAIVSGCSFFSSNNRDVQRKMVKSDVTYTVVRPGSKGAPKAVKGSHVVVHYTGWLNEKNEKGQQFDSSFDRFEPFDFVVGEGKVIQGWDKGIIGMQVGEKRRLVIPSDMAYGARGYPPVIPPHAALIFDVELIEIL